jgi:brefeldin A-resistance guanine nucleotide exchange factor 1
MSSIGLIQYIIISFYLSEQLLSKDRVSMFAAVVRVGFLLFQSLRSHLKLQLEKFLVKLMDIVSSESQRMTYELRELALG